MWGFVSNSTTTASNCVTTRSSFIFHSVITNYLLRIASLLFLPSSSSPVFGGLDGILTSFAIVAGSAGGSLSPSVVLVLGFSNVFADALSMGVGEFLSSKAHNEWVLSERKREQWELENYPEGEIQEMIDIYVQRGMSLPDATMVISRMSKYPEFFVDIMMAEELQLQVPEDTHKEDSMKVRLRVGQMDRLERT